MTTRYILKDLITNRYVCNAYRGGLSLTTDVEEAKQFKDLMELNDIDKEDLEDCLLQRLEIVRDIRR